MSTGVNGPEALLAVQDRDTELDQLRHRRETMPQRTELRTRETAIAELDARAGSVGAERDGLERRRLEVDREVSDLDRRISDLDRRLKSGEVTATRELSAMVEQSKALARRRSELEDIELELMVEEEPLDAQLEEVASRRAELDREAEGLRREIAAAEVQIDGSINEVTEARAAAAAGVPGPLLEAYERLRTRLGGIGAARLVGASCGGCHLILPATELDRIRREPPDALVTCDQCGRILIR